MNVLVILAILTVCNNPIQIITLNTDTSMVQVIKINSDTMESIGKKMMKVYNKNIIELSDETETVCS